MVKKIRMHSDMQKNVKKIGKQAFNGCKKLKSITISTTKLKSSNVGANAFKGIYSKATVKVAKSKKVAYQKLIKSKGAGKNVKYK
ncbi:MAG: leucine-rich repeat domain-containing protein [Lachnospiraceae bacterium]|nr:leucine-rich repeat domain-containing protein [Lachnospiraceae bacterium]